MFFEGFLDQLRKAQNDKEHPILPQRDPSEVWAEMYGKGSRDSVPVYTPPAPTEIKTGPNPFGMSPEDYAALMVRAQVKEGPAAAPKSMWKHLYGGNTAGQSGREPAQLPVAPNSPNRQRSYTSAFKMPGVGGSQMSNALRAAPSAAGE